MIHSTVANEQQHEVDRVAKALAKAYWQGRISRKLFPKPKISVYVAVIDAAVKADWVHWVSEAKRVIEEESNDRTLAAGL